MAKLILTKACHHGLENVQRKSLKVDDAYKNAVKEANEKIKTNQTHYATAYKNAESFLAQ